MKRITTTVLTAVPVTLLGLGLSGCDPAPASPAAACTGKCDSGGEPVDSAELDVCVAIRGNGPRITAHFGALARIIEHYGLIDATAGGSSGSITSFLLESIQANPYVTDCGESVCSKDEAAGRAALLFKSLYGYANAIGGTEELVAIRAMSETWRQVQERDIESLLNEDPLRGVAALRAILESPELRDLINEEVLEVLAQSPDPVHHARDIIAALQAGLRFEPDGPGVFVRPGIIDFAAFAERVGRIGTFYAAYPPVDGSAMANFLDACAESARGLSWPEVAALPAGESTCGASFAELVAQYRIEFASGSYPSRIDDPIGTYMPALITTSVLEGDAVAAWRQARERYLAAEEPSFTVNFDDVKIGYWGRAVDLAALEANPAGFTDLKTAKRTSLGEASWRHALRYSPAEPGLGRAVELDDGRVSAGGWSDLQPVLALKNIGCENVIFLTRRGGAGGFLDTVTEMLGIDANERAALFALGSADSSYYQSIEESAAVWCTDWDAPSVSDLSAMYAVGYEAPMESNAARFTSSVDAYPGVRSRLDIAGCTLGVDE